VWDVAAGRCQSEVAAHDGGINAIAVCNDRVLTASDDGAVGVWRLRAGWGPREFRPRWGPVCEAGEEWRLRGHDGRVLAVAAWAGGAASGGCDATVRVWDLRAGTQVQALEGHEAWVNALLLLPAAGRLVSSAADGGLRLWAIGSWECLRAVRAPGGDPIRCLAGCGPDVVGGVEACGPEEDSGEAEWRLVVFAADSLDVRRTIAGPAGSGSSGAVWGLVATDGAVWGAVGRDLVAWGLD
jgi:WD40 repeat protein